MSHKHTKKLINSIVLWAALLISMAGTAVAQENQTDGSGVTADDVNLVARELWCPLCSGVRLDACELKACDQMKEVIAIKLAEGEDTQSIKAYFVDQYGPQVLGEPPREGFNWLAWILPVVAVVFGGVFVWRQMGRMVQRPADPDSAATGQPDSAAEDPAPKGDYERKLDEELSRYG